MLIRALALVLAASALAIADPKPASEAERLFREGIALFDEGKFGEACKRFEDSIARDPHAIGTLMNLGRCNEKLGRVATALARFEAAYDRAAQAGALNMRDEARARIAALQPQVPIAVLRRAVQALPGEKLLVDDAVIPTDRARLPLDPGPHTLVLAAPGRLPYETSFETKLAQEVIVELPALRIPVTSATTIRIEKSPRRSIGKAAALAGAGIAVIASGLALYAKHDYDRQFADPDGSGPRVAPCAADLGCNADGQARIDRDRKMGTASGVLGVVGLAATATGLVLWFTAPKERTTVVPTASSHGIGIGLDVRF